MVSTIPILQMCNAVVVLKQRLDSFQNLHNFSRFDFFDIEISVLHWFFYTKISCINVFRSGTTNPVVLFLETVSPAKSLSTKTVTLSTYSCLRNRVAFWVS